MIGTLDHNHEVYQNTNSEDNKLLVRFFIDTMQDQIASAKEGRPIHKDVEYIDIRVPGDRDNVVIRPARPHDKERFARQYQAFKQRIAGKEEAAAGAPLEMLNLPKSLIEELRFFNITTVEALANTSDSIGAKFMGFADLKRKAQACVQAMEGTAPVLKLTKQLEDALARIEVLEKANKDLATEASAKKGK